MKMGAAAGVDDQGVVGGGVGREIDGIALVRDPQDDVAAAAVDPDVRRGFREGQHGGVSAGSRGQRRRAHGRDGDVTTATVQCGLQIPWYLQAVVDAAASPMTLTAGGERKVVAVDCVRRYGLCPRSAGSR